jgi:sporulation protein YlmC with PRC-barrel domain
MAGLALTGGAAIAGAQEQSTQEEWDTQSQTTDPYETQSQTETTDPYETESQSQSQTQTTDPYETQSTDPYSTESQTETGSSSTMQGSTMENPDLSQLSSEELQGKSIVSSTGEEIGTIEKVGYSEQHQDRVAAVNVGGFLGAGEKTIAIPLSDLSMGADTNVTTTMDRETIEQQEEIDPTTLSEDQSSTDPAQQY